VQKLPIIVHSTSVMSAAAHINLHLVVLPRAVTAVTVIFFVLILFVLFFLFLKSKNQNQPTFMQVHLVGIVGDNNNEDFYELLPANTAAQLDSFYALADAELALQANNEGKANHSNGYRSRSLYSARTMLKQSSKYCKLFTVNNGGNGSKVQVEENSNNTQFMVLGNMNEAGGRTAYFSTSFMRLTL